MEYVYIVLSNGHIFKGKPFGAVGESIGELVFTTDMIDYTQTLTDACYYGQIVVQTFPLIGNYGIISADCGAKRSFVRGYIVREWCEQPSNFRCEQTIDAYLKEQGIVGVYDVDTRELTRIIREHGVMTAKIVQSPDQVCQEELDAFCIAGAVENVSANETKVYLPKGDTRYNVVLMDYGEKRGLVRALNERGCAVHVVPYHTSAADILAHNPDGVLLGDGPGNPAHNAACIAQLRSLAGRLPVFGVGLGHQLLALALGAHTTKLKYGHRGASQPVKDAQTGAVYITGQNHGYVVENESVAAAGGELRFVNANDGTCEGIDYPEQRAFSVQFCPESKYTAFLLDRFADMMGGDAHAKG